MEAKINCAKCRQRTIRIVMKGCSQSGGTVATQAFVICTATQSQLDLNLLTTIGSIIELFRMNKYHLFIIADGSFPEKEYFVNDFFQLI